MVVYFNFENNTKYPWICKTSAFKTKYVFFKYPQNTMFPWILQEKTSHTLHCLCKYLISFLYGVYLNLSFPECFYLASHINSASSVSFTVLSEACYFKLWGHHQYLLSGLCICHSSPVPSLLLSFISFSLSASVGTFIFPMSLSGASVPNILLCTDCHFLKVSL